ncbi:hypothetical protein RMONA_04665 [Rickettsia monacensis]|uniref:Uncharacterized protein n=1 Tax=Rickettsia monacensis TaxID=109232 RepID=A0A0B7J4H2_9RICK|nr:hypothetical protein RMONA_4125 [Rickettsia monacensis IrR/Munich]CEO17318.1 hypothetical protein RMONA_04665 [Rickettsia monacensis]
MKCHAVCLSTASRKTIKNTNNFSIWIPWSSHGMTEVKLIHVTIPSGNDIGKVNLKKNIKDK